MPVLAGHLVHYSKELKTLSKKDVSAPKEIFGSPEEVKLIDFDNKTAQTKKNRFWIFSECTGGCHKEHHNFRQKQSVPIKVTNKIQQF